MNYKTNYTYKDLKRAQRVKKNRLKTHILSMLQNNNNCLFLTFTFNNRVLKNTNQLTREKYIKRYLNRFASAYILNIDYGANTKREHYHAIATPKYKIFLYSHYNKKYGFVNGEQIGSLKRFANINKSIQDIAERLTEHATKETTENQRIIYSRNKDINIDLKLIDEIDKYLLILESAKAQYDDYKMMNKREEQTEEEIKHPKEFYYINDQDFIYRIIEKKDNQTFIYKAIKYDSINGFKESTIIYNKESQIYKRYLNYLAYQRQDIINFE